MVTLEKVKQYLKITWDDEDDNILEIIESSKSSLNELAGTELDYEKPGLARSLFLNRCRYDYNNALEYFEGNFAPEILRLQLLTGVRELEKDAEP